MALAKSNKKTKQLETGSPGRFGYFFSRAVLNIRQNIFINLVTIGTISLALLLISLFLIVFVNLEGIADDWSRKIQVTVYFDKDLAPPVLAGIKRTIESLPETEKVELVSREEAFKRFRSRLKGQESLLDGVTVDVLPVSLEIALHKASRNSVAVESYVQRLKQINGIGEVQYGEEWVKRFSTFMNFMRLVGAILGAFLVIAVLFIVSNTIKLTIYARKDELDVLALVGATRLFIKAPFLIEGMIQGLAGAVISLVILTGCYYGFLYNAGNFLSFGARETGIAFLSLPYLFGILGGGIVIGFLGSLTSLKRFISF